MKISIIIPTYNSKKLDRLLDSLQEQLPKRNLEIIIVDDCSTDRTYEKLMEIQKLDKRLIVLRNEKNSKRR